MSNDLEFIKTIPRVNFNTISAQTLQNNDTQGSTSSINLLVMSNHRLMDELFSAHKGLKEKEQKIINAYKELYKKQLANESIIIINLQKKTICELKTEIKQTKVDTFGGDLMIFGKN